jgi:hypothetical protein
MSGGSEAVRPVLGANARAAVAADLETSRRVAPNQVLRKGAQALARFWFRYTPIVYGKMVHPLSNPVL